MKTKKNMKKASKKALQSPVPAAPRALSAADGAAILALLTKLYPAQAPSAPAPVQKKAPAQKKAQKKAEKAPAPRNGLTAGRVKKLADVTENLRSALGAFHIVFVGLKDQKVTAAGKKAEAAVRDLRNVLKALLAE